MNFVKTNSELWQDSISFQNSVNINSIIFILEVRLALYDLDSDDDFFIYIIIYLVLPFYKAATISFGV